MIYKRKNPAPQGRLFIFCRKITSSLLFSLLPEQQHRPSGLQLEQQREQQHQPWALQPAQAPEQRQVQELEQRQVQELEQAPVVHRKRSNQMPTWQRGGGSVVSY
jgi:hypothetical protein